VIHVPTTVLPTSTSCLLFRSAHPTSFRFVYQEGLYRTTYVSDRDGRVSVPIRTRASVSPYPTTVRTRDHMMKN